MIYRILIVLFSISSLNAQESNDLGSLLYKEVTANVETEPVFAGDDAADDMCVLENFNNPESSLIISSDKKYGIIVYDLEGVKLYDYEVGRINNVDILPSRSFQNKYMSMLLYVLLVPATIYFFWNDLDGRISTLFILPTS